jgi:uncharacterized protein YndB with AHSA1/START domain
MRFIRSENKVGGTSFYEMKFTEGEPMYGLIKYIELHKPDLLLYTQEFCDVNERVIRPPFFQHWPLQMKATVELSAESDQITRVKVLWEPMAANVDDIAEFAKQRPSMTEGWTGSFEKFETLIA